MACHKRIYKELTSPLNPTRPPTEHSWRCNKLIGSRVTHVLKVTGAKDMEGICALVQTGGFWDCFEDQRSSSVCNFVKWLVVVFFIPLTPQQLADDYTWKSVSGLMCMKAPFYASMLMCLQITRLKTGLETAVQLSCFALCSWSKLASPALSFSHGTC